MRKGMNKLIDLDRIPRHIAFIMDGNGRWAKKRGLARTKGHEKGAEVVYNLVDVAQKYKIEAVTLFAFSTENFKRPKEEVDYIFNLMRKAFIEKKEMFKEKNVKVMFIGKVNELDNDIQKSMEELCEETKNNEGITLCIAVNYGARSEIVEAVKKICKDCKDGKQVIEEINEETIENNLMTYSLPPIDLLIRTSGELRISNFLLWQIAYSELLFTKVYWPDFDEKELEKCLIEYQTRDRRFGALK